MNILTQMKMMKGLSHNEAEIVHFILENPGRVLYISAAELSNACFVSTSTIYRLCEKLSVSGYSRLQLRIMESLKGYQQEDDSFDYDFPVDEMLETESVLKRLQDDYSATVASTINLFNIEDLRCAVEAMRQAEEIDIFTSAGNVFFAQNFRFQMMEIGKRVHVPVDEYHQRLLAAEW